jgi:hypothetical protein
VTADQLRAVITAVRKMAEYGYRRIGLVDAGIDQQQIIQSVGAAIVPGTTSTPAANVTWNGGGADNKWANAANWNSNGHALRVWTRLGDSGFGRPPARWRAFEI